MVYVRVSVGNSLYWDLSLAFNVSTELHLFALHSLSNTVHLYTAKDKAAPLFVLNYGLRDLWNVPWQNTTPHFIKQRNFFVYCCNIQIINEGNLSN